MESKMPLSANAQRIADDIVRLVEAQDQVTFVEIDQRVPGFRARRGQDGRDLTGIPPFDTVILWTGVTADGIDAMAFLFEAQLARPAFIPHLAYQQCGDVPKLSLIGSVPLTKQQWLPAVLKRGTAEQDLRALEVFAEAKLAGRGAAPIH
jgi:hypothetical protein